MSERVLKGLLWWLAIFHVGLGLLGIFAKETAVFLAGRFFNFNLELTPQMHWVLNPFAAYLLAFGVFMAIAALDPLKYRNIIYAGVGLLALRVIQRAVFVLSAPNELRASTSLSSNVFTIVVVSTIAVTVFLLTRRLQ